MSRYFKANSSRLKRQLQKGSAYHRDKVERGAKTARAIAQNTPIDTGRTARRTRVAQITSNGFEIEVDVPHALSLEEGHKAFWLKPVPVGQTTKAGTPGKGFLAWKTSSGVFGGKDGYAFTTNKVRIPKTKGSHHIRDTMIKLYGRKRWKKGGR